MNKCIRAYSCTIVAAGALTASIAPMSADQTITTPLNNVDVTFNVDVIHSVDDYKVFDRKKYITIHSTETEEDWYGNNDQSKGAPNASADLITEVMDGYDVYFGRDTGGMKYQLSMLPEDKKRIGYADKSAAAVNGKATRQYYSFDKNPNAQKSRSFAHRNPSLIVGAHQRPYWPDGGDVGKGWSFSQADTSKEPIGTAMGNYMGLYLSKYFSQSTHGYGQKKPTYVEVMNEPLFELVEYPGKHKPAKIEDIFRLHNSVANEIRKTNKDVKVGGYTVAFPDYERDNFDEWKNRDRRFMEIAGKNMDFISMHLYDFPNIPYSKTDQREQYRKGSNMEATLDLIEQYMQNEWGEIKPLLISEYGSQLQGLFNKPWTPYRDWLCVKAMNSMLLSLLERPNRIEKAIPFMIVKGEWGRISPEIPYYWRLMRQAKEAEGETGDEWVFTDHIKFYQLWSDVNGKRSDSWASDMDIQVDSYVNGKELFLIINSLEFSKTQVDLNIAGLKGNKVRNVEVKHLYLDKNKKPQLDVTKGSSIPRSVTLGAEATMIIKVSCANSVSMAHSSKETKYYADKTVQPITAGKPLTFAINKVTKGTYGEAVLRLGIGRNHGKSLLPIVKVNGVAVEVPVDFRGYDQYHNGKGRDTFFGVIEIPVSNSIIAANNTIDVTFGDEGGHISSVTLQNFVQSKQLHR